MTLEPRLPRMRKMALIAVCLVAGVATSCGGASGPHVSSPMSARDSDVFDDAVDYVENPANLGSAWGPASAADMEHRVGAADIVAIVVVRAVRSDTDNTSHRTRRIALDPETVLVGTQSGGLDVAVSELEAGFDTVDGHESQLLQRRFVLFVKWADGGREGVVPRWHLAPASDPITADVRRLVRQRSPGTSGN